MQYNPDEGDYPTTFLIHLAGYIPEQPRKNSSSNEIYLLLNVIIRFPRTIGSHHFRKKAREKQLHSNNDGCNGQEKQRLIRNFPNAQAFPQPMDLLKNQPQGNDETRQKEQDRKSVV